MDPIDQRTRIYGPSRARVNEYIHEVDKKFMISLETDEALAVKIVQVLLEEIDDK